MEREKMFSVLKSNLRAEIKELAGRTIQETDGPRQLGGHSLRIIEAIGATMKDLSISVPRDELMKTRDLGDVLDLFERSASR